MKRCWRSARRHLSSMMEVIWWSGGAWVQWVKWEIWYRVKGILNKESYHSVLPRHTIHCWGRLIAANFLWQQDNDSKHSSKLCKNYFGKKQSAGIRSIMERPAQSPDLRTIKLLWEQLDQMVRTVRSAYQANPGGASESMGWHFFSHYLNKLTARMPKVCKAWIAANGGFFDKSKVWMTKL